jgi:ribonuclease P/MRP protein subunit RPP1
MRFYDLQVFSNFSTGEHTISEMASMAERLGWSGIAIADVWSGHERLKHLKDSIAAAQQQVKIELVPAVTLRPKDVPELKRQLDEVRKLVTLVIVAGGDYNINRAACEDGRADIIVHPELGRPDSGLDDICLSAAAANGVAVGVSFNTVLRAGRKARARVLQHMAMNVQLCAAFRVPIILVSGGQSKWELRDPRQLIALAGVLGAELPHAFAAAADVPTTMIERNKRKLAGTSVGGVEVLPHG